MTRRAGSSSLRPCRAEVSQGQRLGSRRSKASATVRWQRPRAEIRSVPADALHARQVLVGSPARGDAHRPRVRHPRSPPYRCPCPADAGRPRRRRSPAAQSAAQCGTLDQARPGSRNRDVLAVFASGETRTRTGATTIFSRAPNVSNKDEIPGRRRVSSRLSAEHQARYLRSFALGMGTRIAAGTQTEAWRRAARVLVVSRMLAWSSGVAASLTTSATETVPTRVRGRPRRRFGAMRRAGGAARRARGGCRRRTRERRA
jgi:hypothetical protein